MSLIGSIIGAFFSAWIQNIIRDPLIILHFLVPIIMIFVAMLAVEHRSKKTKVDALPTIEQKKEKFVLPDDFLNRELDSIKSEDYRHFLDPMVDDLEGMRNIVNELKVLRHSFARFEKMSESTNQRRRKKGMEGQRKVFNDILELYRKAGNMKFGTVEAETTERRRIL